MRLPLRRTVSLFLAILGAAQGCSRNATSSVPVALVTVTPPSSSVQVTGTVQLAATAKDANGNVLTGRAVTWSSNGTNIATVDGAGLVTGAGLGQTTIQATVEGQTGNAAISVTSPVCSTSGGQPVTLAAGAYTALTPPAGAGCLMFPANGSAIDSAQYLLVPQIATDSEGASTPILLYGDTLHAALAASVVASPLGRAGMSWGERFHDFLRREERNGYAGIPRTPLQNEQAVVSRLPPPTVGSTRTFKVCSNISCGSTQSVTATAKTVTGHLAIYVDNAAPSGGLSQADLDSLGALFDARLYAIDTTAFGRESDIDGNTVVAVLMTNVVNKLVTATQCQSSGFIAGFFFGADIDPLLSGQFNHGEVFYSIVADPNGTLSCAHSVSQLKRLVPVTFIHEFQHMISYNQHVLVRSSSPQATWLDEGMSHFAEELGGRSFLPANQARFSDFVIGDLFNAYTYLDSTEAHFLAFSAGIGTLAERGAAWLFMRYIADQFAADTSFTAIAALTRNLEETNLVGGADIANATGTPFATIVERWVLANYVSDLPGFTAPPELQYVSWHLRTTYASLNAQNPSVFPKPFPLTPPLSSGAAIAQVGRLRAGSGAYALAAQLPSGPGFDLLFSGPNDAALPEELVPRLNIIRIR